MRDLIQHPLFSIWSPKDPDVPLWYRWRLEHWGTKWQPDTFQVEGAEVSEAGLVGIPVYGGEAEVMVAFDTANYPPLPVILAMSRTFPTLRFELRYFECGCRINGMYVCEGGEVQADETGAYFGYRGG
jgi:hypothetical protein